jgi:propionate CoA-transferase
MRDKVTSIAEAMATVQSGDTVCTSGFVGMGGPDALLKGLEERFLKTGEPRDLTLVFAAGQGDGKDRGLNALGYEGLLKRAVGGHWGLVSVIMCFEAELGAALMRTGRPVTARSCPCVYRKLYLS